MARLRDVHGGELRSIRQPLLAALDLEYVRAANKRDTARMAEIMTIMELLNNLWPDAIPLSAPHGQPILAMPAPPQYPPAPVANIGPRPGWVREAIKAAEAHPPDPLDEPAPPEMRLPDVLLPKIDDASLRRAAKARIMMFTQQAGFNTADEQMEYEVALMAHNKNVEAMSQLEPRAAVAKMTVADFSELIINRRRVKERRMMHVKAVAERCLAELDSATGEDIGRIEREAVAAIEGNGATP